MAPLSFRVSVPANTPALAPVEIILKPSARFLRYIVGPYSLTAGLDNSKSGYRLFDRGHSIFFLPEVGSNDNAIQANPGEAGWAPILPSAQKIDMANSEIQGPPFELTLSFFNTSSGPLIVAGYIIAEETFIVLDRSMLYSFLEKSNPPREFVLPTEAGALEMEHPAGAPGKKAGRQ